jgi:hypothetical protein
LLAQVHDAAWRARRHGECTAHGWQKKGLALKDPPSPKHQVQPLTLHATQRPFLETYLLQAWPPFGPPNRL